MEIGSWLARQLATWPALDPGRQALPTALHLTPAGNPLALARRTRHTLGQTVQLLELFLHREGRAPAAREAICVAGDTVKSGAWLAKARTKHRSGRLPEAHAHLVAALFEEDWTLPVPHRLGGRPVKAWSRRSVRHLDRLVGVADRGPEVPNPTDAARAR
ncbi:hypothetical protein [Streptomyces sp. NPDC048737]|uniref:hypothetical protein n=1 Tax=unclassified Streptomyces TaxID=2593676 RepID=UPI00343C40EB